MKIHISLFGTMSKIAGALTILACAGSVLACATHGDTDAEGAAKASVAPDRQNKKLSLQEESPQLWDLLQRTRQQGRRPSDAELSAIRMMKVSGPAESRETLPMSENNDLTVNTPDMWKTDDNLYYTLATWRWNVNEDEEYYGWADDSGPWRDKIGGVDAFGLHYSRPVVDVYSDTAFCPLNWDSVEGVGQCWVTNNTRVDANEQNVVHSFQEIAGPGVKWWQRGINMYQGDIAHVFKAVDGSCVQAWSTYAHTWDEAQINGFSLGVDALGIQWAPSEEGWKKVSLGSELFCPQ